MLSPRDDLQAVLRALSLTAMADAAATTALRAAKEGLSHETYLLELGRIELAAKHSRRTERLRKQSGLLPGKTLHTLDMNRFDASTRMQMERLQTGAFLKDAINVIAVGRPGAGKSHFACALGHALVELGYPVLFSPTAALVQRLLAAKRDLRLPQELAKLDRYECIILDDIGYVQHDRDEMEVLFTLLAERYERKSRRLIRWSKGAKNQLPPRNLHHAESIGTKGSDVQHASVGDKESKNTFYNFIARVGRDCLVPAALKIVRSHTQRVHRYEYTCKSNIISFS